MLFYIIGYTVLGLKVLFGLGFVIFVHELGHFIVAKMCGVKCEKFYLGFDIGGLKFCKFRYGETEYGIGIFPLGGYVKMLGQDDNPAKMCEEMERARGAGAVASGQWPVASEGTSDSKSPNPQIPKSVSPNPQSLISNPSLFDPRSFLAKSVPKRMAIISAGVIMNVIFAFFMAVVAFGLGVKQTPCVVGEVFPGRAAWQADLRPGDKVLEIAGKKMWQFRDLQAAISLGDIVPEDGVQVLIERSGVTKPFLVRVKPDRSLGAFFIGVAGGMTTQLNDEKKTWLVKSVECVMPGSAAAQAQPPFQHGDRVVRIDDAPIDNYGQIVEQLARKADKDITVVVERIERNAKGKPTGEKREVPIAVKRRPMRTLGLVMKMGKVTAVQANSPAVEVGIEPGDVIAKIDGQPVGDPMTLPARLSRRAGETVELTLEHAKKKARTVKVLLRQPIEYATPMLFSCPKDASALGVAYEVLNTVESVVEGSPAAKAGMKPGDFLESVRLIPAKEDAKGTGTPLRQSTLRTAGDLPKEKEIALPFGEAERNWTTLVDFLLPAYRPGATIEVTFTRDKKKQEPVKLTTVDAEGWFNPDRGFVFEQMTFDRTARSIGEAFALGGQETLDSLTMVFRSVKALSTNQVSMRAVAGPVKIIEMALQAADQGNARFLLFLTMLSANLAVLNFLPIPVLDGGHMMFLLYEGIRGKPADERVQAVLSYIGLFLILSLMVWALGLDFGLISRHAK